ncbi:Ras GTPase activating protein ira2 [Rhizopus stolonifer]|uniref:Ras GTPase activating protein ira2 n=1 Tax=Rhizopus stolonifer TaxID=4846 RepID=A0A367KYI8_RHIST|nr:Ras GTPase activating protein ira2 [Rhizopus stolonifer]
MSRYITQYHLIEETDSEVVPQQIYDYDKAKYTYAQIKLSLITEIYKSSSRILQYVSSSNWDACYAKIKRAALVLGSATKNSDEIPPEIRMLECSRLNKERLQIIFKDLNPYYLHMKLPAKLLFSRLMKRAIWRWIECYPSEFAQVFTTAQPLTDSELLFDVCNSTADSSKKRAILWPLQTILLILSTESLKQAFLGQSSNRRFGFLNLLRKSLQATKYIDLIVVCYVDICKAATYVPPDEESILRTMAEEVEKDLTSKIWDFTKLVNAGSSMSVLGYTIDQKTLATDFLLSRIRLDKEDAIKTLVPPCININAPIVVKIALVKSCLAILLEENHLPWNPTLESLYSGLCQPLRMLLLQTIQLETDIRKKENTISNHTNRVELLVDILRLYRADPFFAISGEGSRVEENGLLMSGLASLLTYPVQVVRQAAAELLVKLHRIEYASHWTQNPNDMNEFWKVSSPAIIVISQSMMDTSLSGKMQKFMLDTMIKLLKTRTAFLKQKQNMFTRESAYSKDGVKASISLEIALLVFLCSAHKDVCDESSVCIKALCQESKIVDVWDEGLNSMTLAANLEVYEMLSADNYQFIGRKAQQKKFRKCLQSLLHHTPSCFAAWEEVWKRWKLLTPLVNRQEESEENLNEINGSNKKLPLVGKVDKTRIGVIPSPTISKPQIENYEEKSLEWHNFTGFLAALGGCCLTRDKEMDEVISFSSETSRQTTNQPIIMVEAFVSEMTEMLVSENVYVREGIKDTLGNDLSPDLFAILFRHLEHLMSKCFDSNGKAIRNLQNKLFVEQSVLVLKLILDRLGNSSDCLLNIDFSTLMRQFIDYLDGVPNTSITLRIKIKMCMLVESLMQKKERIIIQDGIVLRNRILEIFVEWTSDVALSRKPLEGGPQVERLQQDLDYACIKTIVNVLHELPLQPLDSIRAYDSAAVNNRLFLKYFNFFRTLLDRYKRTEKDFVSHRLTMEKKDSAFKPTSDSYQHIAMMKELTILAMSHLLSANVETGLKYSLSMGYDDDEKTRTSFMQVLTNILEHGTEFDMLAEGVTTERYEKLVDMLVEADREVVLALCDVCPSSDISGLAEVLLICFESRHKTTSLFRAIVDREVAQTQQEATLFRGTTMATRILSLYAKLTCIDYIRSILSPVFEYINSLPNEQLTWELDPQKANPAENVSKNMQNVIHVTETILNAVLPTANNFPLLFRKELDVICKSVSVRFPESKYTAVGSFVFLRLFGPIILSPENSGFTKNAIPKNNNVRKILLQAARIIQNLSSNVIFGPMETHMIKLNEFLTKNAYNVMAFLRHISTVPADASLNETNIRADQTGHFRLHKYLSSNLERMSKELTGKHMAKGSDAEKALRSKKTLDDFSTILAQLGRPSEIPNIDLLFKRPGKVTISNQQYAEFMRKNAHRDLSVMSSANIFYLGGKSKAGRPVFYMSASSLKSDDIDFESYIYYSLKVKIERRQI